ncbi:hypothetical protein [Bacillus sp. MRMR6]|uniref:hypothetical protein n=1 Tax=Bacillus sp. MRMR6 TaxID=1928617 RepID=UPI0009527FA7|nr:hypothetical protein [Bacillus sp. MRMR6]OLS39103.1 hypothetical protein BTR25_13290 [Bacillus sp. MRMR6]
MRKEMSIDEKLVIIREAMEKGAEVHVSFHGVISQSAGKEIIERMAELTGAKIRHSEKNQSYGFEVLTGPSGFDAAVFYEPSKEDYKSKLLKQLAELEEEVTTL